MKRYLCIWDKDVFEIENNFIRAKEKELKQLEEWISLKWDRIIFNSDVDCWEIKFSEFNKGKNVTNGKGVNTIVEVSGVASALNTALNVAARQARIALNGCTRVSDAHIDFYKQVHCPGITIIGAHNTVRPLKDSYQGYWTNEEDVLTLVRLISGKRINVKPLLNEIHSPNDCEEVFRRLCTDKNFPIGVVFDWSKIK